VKDLAGKVAVVTGGGSGIGRALALALADEGMDVAVADYEAAAAERVANDVAETGVRSLAATVDVSDRAAMYALADRVFAELGGCHLLCNNAGVMLTGPALEVDDDAWDWIVNVNLGGAIHGLQAFLPRMVAQGQGGHVVNTASMVGMQAGDRPGLAAYRTTKYGIVGLTESLAVELSGHGIGCSLLCPGLVRTLLTESGEHRPARFGGPSLPSEQLRAATPLFDQSGMDPARVAELVVRAVKEDQFYIFTHPETGADIDKRLDRILEAYEWTVAESRA
jgi:NAD(P)-dependent dehydrogenase (short-subunit alcohol dehydrogenase family)